MIELNPWEAKIHMKLQQYCLPIIRLGRGCAKSANIIWIDGKPVIIPIPWWAIDAESEEENNE